MGFGFKQPLVGEKRCVTTLTTTAKETISDVACGILRLSSIIFNSPFECDVIQLNVRSGPR